MVLQQTVSLVNELKRDLVTVGNGFADLTLVVHGGDDIGTTGVVYTSAGH